MGGYGGARSGRLLERILAGRHSSNVPVNAMRSPWPWRCKGDAP